ncbi:MAG: diguanylate cyclase [Chloroflexota bacterium]
MMSTSNNSPDILVVDDNIQNLKLLISLLDKKGYLARPVNNGAGALRAVHAAPPDLILLDINMPEMDGYDVCEKLKDDPDTREIPIIFLSAYQDVQEKLKAFQVGGVDYITKPFAAEEVFARVEKHLSIIALQKQLEQQNEQLRTEIFEREKAEAELGTLAQAVNCGGSPILITDLDGKIEFVNQAFLTITGYQSDEVIGQTPSILKSGKTEPDVYADLWGTISQGKVWRGELLNRRKNGELYWDNTVIAPITDDQGHKTHYVAIWDDITERKEEEMHHAYLATHDILTGLPNRAFFNERISHALKMAKRNHWQVAVFFIDLNDFKAINDQFGHLIGDDALIEFGKRLQAGVRESDTVARLSGDEFACLLEKIPDKKYLSLVANKLIDNMTAPYQTRSENSVNLTASIGISIYPDDGDEPDGLLGKADQAMYEAKKHKGKDHYNFYHHITENLDQTEDKS